MLNLSEFPAATSEHSEGTLLNDLEVRDEELHDAIGAVTRYVRALPTTLEEYVGYLRGAGGLPDHNWLEEARADRPPDVTSYGRGVQAQEYVAKTRWLRRKVVADVLGRKVQELRARVVPKSFYFLLAVLLGLLIIGVIAPMVVPGREGRSIQACSIERIHPALWSRTTAGNFAACDELIG